MTKRQREQHIQDIRNLLIDNGWELDRWGNYKKGTRLSGLYRVKMQKTSLRFETKGSGTGGWINLKSDYYKNIKISGKDIIIKGIPYGS